MENVGRDSSSCFILCGHLEVLAWSYDITIITRKVFKKSVWPFHVISQFGLSSWTLNLMRAELWLDDACKEGLWKQEKKKRVTYQVSLELEVRVGDLSLLSCKDTEYGFQIGLKYHQERFFSFNIKLIIGCQVVMYLYYRVISGPYLEI